MPLDTKKRLRRRDRRKTVTYVDTSTGVVKRTTVPAEIKVPPKTSPKEQLESYKAGDRRSQKAKVQPSEAAKARARRFQSEKSRAEKRKAQPKKQAQGLGFIPESSVLSREDNLVTRAARDLIDVAVHTPGGIYALGKAGAKDVRDIVQPGRRSRRRPFGRTAEIGEAIGRQYAKDYRHPLGYLQEHPGFVALDLSALASAGAGTAARVGAVRQTGSLSAALKRPLPPTRTHTFEGQPVRGRYSTNPSVRAVQQARDKRSGGAIGATKAERLLSEERRITDAAAKAPALRALAASKGVSTPEDMAIRVAAEGLPLDQVIEAHVNFLTQLEKRVQNRRRGGVPAGGESLQGRLRLDGRSGKELREKIKLLEAARPYLDVDEEGRAAISAAHPQLREKFEVAAKTAGTREERLKGAGLLDYGAAEGRIQAPGRALRGRTVSGGRAVKVERPRTLEEAEGRLTKLEARIDKSFKPLVEKEYQSNRQDYLLSAEMTRQKPRDIRAVPKEEEMPRFKRGGQIDIQRAGEKEQYIERSGKEYLGKSRSGRDIAEGEVIKRLRASEHPLAKKFVALIDEADQLRRAIQTHAEPEWMRDPGQELPSLGTIPEFAAPEAFQGGRFRVPDVRPSKRPKGPLQYRGGVPRKPGTLTHEYTGALRRSGGYTPNTLRAIAEDALEAERYLSVERFRKRILPMGKRIRPPDVKRRGRPDTNYVPVRERPLTKAEADQLRQIVREVDPETITPDEAARIDAALDSWIENLFPERQYAATRTGDSVPGIVWVDKRLLGSQRKLIGSLGPLDVAQDAVKGLILYGKPGYVTPNVLGNIGYNLIQQGFLAPANWGRAAKLPKDLAFMIDEVQGHGFARALAEGTTSPISGSVQKAGNFWSRFVDTPFRRASFIHEARRYGFKSHEQMRDLIENPAHRALVGEIGQRARDAIIDYERMGPVERDVVRRVLFVYPWIKGSTYYAGQFLRDHPIQAAVFAGLSKQGEAISDRELGELPAWARGSFKVGGTKERPFLVNPTAISPFATPGGVVASALGGLGEVEQSENIGEMASPLLQSAIEAGFGRDLFSGRKLEGSYPEKFGEQLGKGLPQYRLYERVTQADEPETQRKTYPYGVGSAISQFMLGSSAPRPANLEKLQEQAPSTRNPADRIANRIEDEKQEVTLGLRKKAPEELADPEVRKAMDTAYQRKGAVETARLRASLATGSGEPYYREALRQEIRLLRKWGEVEKEDLADVLRIAEKGSVDEVKAVREELGETFDELYLSTLRELREAAGVKR